MLDVLDVVADVLDDVAVFLTTVIVCVESTPHACHVHYCSHARSMGGYSA